jgi:agarase
LRLKRWNINTIGAWSTLRGQPYVIEVPLSGKYVDVFDDQFEADMHTAAQDALRRNDVGSSFRRLDADPLLIGYFTDNELAWGWGYGWSGKENEYSLFEYYASLTSDPGKKVWVDYLARTYTNDWQRFSRVWNVTVTQRNDLFKITKIAPRDQAHMSEAERVSDGFLRLVAERYFSRTDALMRRYLPHHLNLGPRFAEGVPDVVVEIAAQHVDVLSLNIYTRDLEHFQHEVMRVWHAGRKPVLVTEFSFPARLNRSGNRNEGYLHAQVEDQDERGVYYERCAQMLSKLPFIVGYHWFQYFDEPTNGRNDGESGNFGFVDLDNRIYEPLAEAASRANAQAAEWHRSSAAQDRSSR